MRFKAWTVGLALAWAALLLIPGSRPAAAQDSDQPEIHTGFTEKQAVRAKSFMIAAANPHAAEAGRDMLKRGGAAIDAAIAAALVLGLVEPQASGPGGDGYLMHWSTRERHGDSYDGRVTAPAAAGPDLFLGPDGKPRARDEVRRGGIATGVPGQFRLFAAAHAKHGKLPWKDLFQPAIALAEKGFAVSPRLHQQVRHSRRSLTHPATRAYFLSPEGDAWPVGQSVIYTRPSLGDLNVYRVGPGLPTQAIPPGPEKAKQPRVSGDAAWIYYQQTNSAGDFWRVRPDGSAAESVLARPPGVLYRWPAPSPSGTRLLHARFENALPEGQRDSLHVRNLATGAVASLPAQAHFSRWSPDESRIAYRDIFGDLRVIDADGASDTRTLRGMIVS